MTNKAEGKQTLNMMFRKVLDRVQWSEKQENDYDPLKRLPVELIDLIFQCLTFQELM